MRQGEVSTSGAEPSGDQEDAIATAIRHRLRAMIDAPLSTASLDRMERLCRHAREILSCVTPDSGSDIDQLDSQLGGQLGSTSMLPSYTQIGSLSGPVSSTETFAARAFRELIPAITRQNHTPDRLMSALKDAKEVGDDEMEKLIRTRLRDMLGGGE